MGNLEDSTPELDEEPAGEMVEEIEMEEPEEMEEMEEPEELELQTSAAHGQDRLAVRIALMYVTAARGHQSMANCGAGALGHCAHGCWRGGPS